MEKYLILLLIPIIYACSNPRNKETGKQVPHEGNIVDSENKIEELPPLVQNELSLTDKDFGQVIELEGASHPVEHIFKVKECEMIALDSLLIVKNQNNSEMFMAFSLPDFKFIKS